MKKIKQILLIMVIMIIPFSVYAEDNTITSYGNYDLTVKSIQEVLRDYYIKGDRIQYNSARAGYGTITPEEATTQDNQYLVCSAYAYAAYNEAFGVNYNDDKFPAYSFSVTNDASKYYQENNGNPNKLDGNYLIYYERKGQVKYIYDNKINVSDFAEIIQPGDLFAFTNHEMIAYQKVERTPGHWDVLMIHSSGGRNIRSRISGTSNLYYHTTPTTLATDQNILNIDKQGAIKLFWLSEQSNLVKNGRLDCQKNECAVIRPYYKDGSSNTKFNYPISANSYEKTTLRVEYPGLDIEKTIDKTDNNSVSVGDELEYTIKITNKSNTTPANAKNYGKFYIIEELSDLVEYVSSDGELNNNKITFTVNNLNIGESTVLKYKVKVKDVNENIGKKITSKGEFKKELNSELSLPTGTVTNKIIPKTPELRKSYNDCYNEYKDSKKGTDLINSIYICSHEIDYHLDSFEFSKLFKKKENVNNVTANAMVFQDVNDDSYKYYKKMILNDLWSGVITVDSIEDEETTTVDIDQIVTSNKFYLPKWKGDIASSRNKNIIKEYFKNGDILLYSIDYSKTPDDLRHTKENGLYAYIYLDGKFIGVNGDGDISRNEFTANYYQDKNLDIKTHLYQGYDDLDTNKDEIMEKINYQTLFDKDYYVVLRPELVKDEIIANQVLLGVPDTKSNQYTLFIILSIVLLSSGIYIIYKQTDQDNVKKTNK